MFNVIISKIFLELFRFFFSLSGTCWYFSPLNIFTAFISMAHLNENCISRRYIHKTYYIEKRYLSIGMMCIHVHI